MERMLIFYMLFFCSSVALTAPPQKIAKYKQLLKTIQLLEATVKDKGVEQLHTPENPVDECLSTAVSCFQRGVLKLQPANSKVRGTFNQTVRVLKNFAFSSPGECESSCESYQKKSPKEFLKNFEKLMMKLLKA